MAFLALKRQMNTCPAGSAWYVCNSGRVVFTGCCSVEACTTGCPDDNPPAAASSTTADPITVTSFFSLPSETVETMSIQTTNFQQTSDSSSSTSSTAITSTISNSRSNTPSPSTVITSNPSTETVLDQSTLGTTQDHIRHDKAAIIGSTIGAVLLVALISVFFFLQRRKRSKANKRPLSPIIPYIANEKSRPDSQRHSAVASPTSNDASDGASPGDVEAGPNHSTARQIPVDYCQGRGDISMLKPLPTQRVADPVLPDSVPCLDSKAIVPVNELPDNTNTTSLCPPPSYAELPSEPVSPALNNFTRSSADIRASYMTNMTSQSAVTAGEHATSWSQFEPPQQPAAPDTPKVKSESEQPPGPLNPYTPPWMQQSNEGSLATRPSQEVLAESKHKHITSIDPTDGTPGSSWVQQDTRSAPVTESHVTTASTINDLGSMGSCSGRVTASPHAPLVNTKNTMSTDRIKT